MLQMANAGTTCKEIAEMLKYSEEEVKKIPANRPNN